MTLSGSPIRKGEHVMRLLETLQLAAKIAILKCSVNRSGDGCVTVGNQYPEEFAQYCAHGP